MLHITKVMIAAFNITDIDFMGYSVDKDSANFHHLIIPKRNHGIKSINNGAILNKDTSHPYLHIIETKDYDIFYKITKEMMEENRQRKLSYESFKKINELLLQFEREHSGERNFNGEELIREEYVKRLHR